MMGFLRSVINAITGRQEFTPEATISMTVATGYTTMRNLLGLFEAVCDVYDDVTLAPRDGQTFCNVAANRIATAMGCKDLAAKTADEICAFVATSPDWSEIAFDRAQDLANQGSLVFAMASSTMLEQSHGHICAIRPGLPKNSGKWGLCPSVINIGGVNFLARAKSGPLIGMPVGLNEAFVPLPKLYAWRPTL
jgi:hypothetical protein